jgi:hypothetical protein
MQMADEENLEPVQRDWVFRGWLIQLVFFFACGSICLYGNMQGTVRPGCWYYLGFSTAVIVVATLGLLLSSTLRACVGMAMLIVAVYMIPFSLYAYGQPYEISVLGGLLFLVVAIAVSPNAVGFATLLAAVGFAAYMRYYKWELGSATFSDFFAIGGGYLAAGILAFCWRSLISSMYDILSRATGRSEDVQKREVGELKRRIEEINVERQLLKEEIALHIIEIKQIATRRPSS